MFAVQTVESVAVELKTVTGEPEVFKFVRQPMPEQELTAVQVKLPLLCSVKLLHLKAEHAFGSNL